MAQSTGATFGTIVSLGGTPSDMVLDESRARLYLVSKSKNRVDIFSYESNSVITSIPVGGTPLAAAMSMDSAYLYVTNNADSTLSVINLATLSVEKTVTLSAAPEGVEVGSDNRVLISTEGAGTSDSINSLLLYDSTAPTDQQIVAISFPPPATTPTGLSVSTTTSSTTFTGKLIRNADGSFIVGMSNVNSNAYTVVFVYETASGAVLRSRKLTGQSTVLSIAPGGSRFMAGYTLYDTATLAAVAQQNVANIPFPLSSTTTASFNTRQNVGGSVFSPDGETLYSAFNVAPFSTPATRVQAATLLISNAHHLATRLGIKIPESIVAKMVRTSDGSKAWGLSESGLVYLPLSTLYQYPILQPATTSVFLAVDNCNRGLATGSLNITNAGTGKLTFSVPDTTSALAAETTTGVVPAAIKFTLEPGRAGVTRQYGTNLYSGNATNSGTPLTVNLSSPEAINVPNTIRVFMNVRQADQRGVVYPIVGSTTNTEGMQDILVDEVRGRVYITNSGYNRIEVFDRASGVFLTPIEVGQLPHQMALAADGATLYVANTGGESISIVDLDAQAVVNNVAFPAIPRAATSAPVSPAALAWTAYGLQVVMSDGSKWKVVSNTLTVRAADSVTPTPIPTTTANGPVRMQAAADGLSMITMAGNGTVYVYDGLTDAYSGSNIPYTTTGTINGYYGPLSAAPTGNYFLMNGLVLNPSLSAVAGSESPSTSTSNPLASKRNVAAVAAIDANQFVRLTTPVKSSLTATPTSDARPTLELANIATYSVTTVGALAENPVQTLIGTTRINVPPRQIAVDSSQTAYILTLSGLTVVPLASAGRPKIASGSSAVLNSTDGTAVLRAGSFVTISGTNLASAATASTLPVPNVLGGSCVTFSDIMAPLIQTAPGQITAQVPDTLTAGTYVLMVRSLATGQQSDALVVTIQKSK